MKYLVIMEAVEGGPAVPPQTIVKQVEGQVFPSFEILKSLEEEGKIMGGACVGERRIAFIAKAADNTEVDNLIKSLPLWGMATTEVTALNGFAERHEADIEFIAQLKKMES